MAPYGFSVDIGGKQDLRKFCVGPGEETFGNDFVFEAMGKKALYVSLCDGEDAAAACYKVVINANDNNKVEIYKDGAQKKSKQHNGNNLMVLKSDSFNTYRIKLELAGSILSVKVGSRYKEFYQFIDWDDAGEHIAVNWVWIKGAANFYEPQYIRNFRRHGSTEVCSNNVGSFTCRSTEEEYMAIGYGGHTTSSSNYPTRFTVVTKDQYDCHNHNIPDLSPGRYGPGVQVMGNYLYVCGGHYYGARYGQVFIFRFK